MATSLYAAARASASSTMCRGRRHSIASIAPVGVVCMAPVISLPKQGSLCNLPNFDMAAFFLTLCHQMREPYLTMEIITLKAITGIWIDNMIELYTVEN
ncbi:hypothetical protein NQ318_016634 [Aromia moschata]|uniref:Uncharacterized protein n=1 Tax=Aromia moschata TaxID=1265417 RepID=A0AAV8XTM0_9CUCU|nr:hypothetical protein NQ318_016634 [Aromia moschata]